MRKTTIALVLTVSLAAGGLFAQKPFVLTATGKKRTYDKITSDASGTLTVTAGKISQKIKTSAYKYAWVPLQQAPEVSNMYRAYKARKYTDVVVAFNPAYKKYRHLGWECFSILMVAKALNNLGKTPAAISKLELIKGKPDNPTESKYYFQAKRLLAELYVKNANLDKAKNALKDLSQSKDDAIVAFANNIRGDIYLKEGKTKDAIIEYAKTALLFEKTNKKERPEALRKIVQLLRQEKNNKAKNFEKILRQEYPGSKYLEGL